MEFSILQKREDFQVEQSFFVPDSLVQDVENAVKRGNDSKAMVVVSNFVYTVSSEHETEELFWFHWSSGGGHHFYNQQTENYSAVAEIALLWNLINSQVPFQLVLEQRV